MRWVQVYNDFIGREEPVGTDHSRGGLAVHLWFCGVCYTKYTEVLNTLKGSFKNSIALDQTPNREKHFSDNNGATINITNSDQSKVAYGSKSNFIQATVFNAKKPDEEANVYMPPDNIVCKYYRKGICRHGSSGKTLWNNLTCPFSHPKKCPKYTKFGIHPIKGCNNRGCKLLHPLLCHNSVMDGKCFNPNCSYQHLQDTVRAQRTWNNNTDLQNLQQNSYGNSYARNPSNSGNAYGRNSSKFGNNYERNPSNYFRSDNEVAEHMRSVKFNYPSFIPQVQPSDGLKINDTNFPPLQSSANEKDLKDTFSSIWSVLKVIQEDLTMLKQNRSLRDENCPFPTAKNDQRM